MSKENPMREVKLEKLTLNVGVGEAGPALEKATSLLSQLAQGAKVVTTTTHKRTTFGGAKGRPIGVKVTIRGKQATELLERLLKTNENRIKPKAFDANGNFSFGIAEYINIPDMKYDPEIGIFGMDISVKMKRFGYHIAKRKLKKCKIPTSNRISPEEVKQFVKSRFDVEVIE